MLTNQHVTLNIPKHMIDKKFMQKIKIKCEMDFQK